MGSSNQQIVEDYIRRYNLKDIEGMLALFSEDMIFESVSSASGIINVEGKEKFRLLSTKTAEIFKVRRQTPTTMVLDVTNAAIESRYWCVLATDLPDGKKAGEEIQFRGAAFFTFADGLIARMTEYL
ncbi:MAG: nuclear transport factor 2 family protein [Proteobacteria bacterium]|nr:nuclear transport factor 2 family protein [Pseudomonadota bacterium]